MVMLVVLLDFPGHVLSAVGGLHINLRAAHDGKRTLIEWQAPMQSARRSRVWTQQGAKGGEP
jgi:hypothetical protein